MSDVEHAQHMLKIVRKDLKALAGMMDEEVFDDEIFGFHAQQTVEKGLKAWLSLIGVKYHKKHDLDLLISSLEENGQTVPAKFLPLVDLTDFAVQFRYDLVDYDTHDLDRKKILADVTEFVNYVENLVANN